MIPTAEEVTTYLTNNPEFAKEYFLKHASPKLVENWVLHRSQRLSIPSVNRVNKLSSNSCADFSSPSSLKPLNLRSVNDDVGGDFVPKKKKKTAEELAGLNEKELLMELIRDIAYELDVDSLSHKILVNVCHLINADRSSLFLCKGHKDRKYLMSRLFDVTADSTVEEAVKPTEKAIIIPYGVGIAGYAAASGETINIKDAYKDPRFNPGVDQDTGYRTHSILCMPIKNQESEVIGVAQLINKKDASRIFTEKDEQVFRDYLTFCGIGLTNAQLFNASVQEYERNQVLLNLARNIFEDTECLETVVRRIMTQAQEMMQCERCTVYIINRNTEDEEEEEDIRFSQVFDLINNVKEKAENGDYYKNLAEKSTSSHPVYAGFAMLAVKNGEILNIDSFTKDDHFSSSETLGKYDDDVFKAKCMLCCPIFNNKQEIIGVAQLFNKRDAHSFDEGDEIMFEGFSIFCGLGIHNTQMFEKASIMLARQNVNMEVLQYHASAGPVDTDELVKDVIPVSDQYDLCSFDFDDINMTDHETCLMSMRMFLDQDLLRKCKVPYKKMCQFILTVKKNYRPVTYHNWRHAFNVGQTMFTLLQTGQMFSWFTDLESLVLLVACLCHDLDHRGTNNTFQQKTESPIARLYGTSTMERHHFDHSVMILKSEGCNIFDSLNDEDYKLVMKLLEEAILSTDLALYFKKRASFQNLVETRQADWTQFENRGVLRGMMMTACDVAAITKPWEIQQRVAELVASEFFEQGDIERNELSSEPIPMMDREKHGELPKMQVGFIDFVCLPLYKVFYHINPLLKPLYDGVVNNKKNWQNMIETYVPENVVIKEPPKDRKASRAHHGASKKPKVSFSIEASPKSKSCVIL